MRLIFIIVLSMLNVYGFAKNSHHTIAPKSLSGCKKFLFNNSLFHASILNTGIGMPPNIINGRLHPGIELGFQKKMTKNEKKSTLDYSFNLGYFSIRSLEQASYLKPGIGYSFCISKRFCIRPSLNGSLMMVRQLNDEFKFKGNGNYETVSPLRFQVAPSLGLETSINLFQLSKMDIGFRLKYEFGVQLPFSLLSSVLPLNQLHIGVNLKPLINKIK